MAQPLETDKYDQLRESMEIHIEENLYDETKLKPLEEYVNKQVSEEAAYDFDSNLYLMKMYSLYPLLAKKDIVIKLLLKALMNLPESDFTSLVYLIPITMQSKSMDAPVTALESASASKQDASSAGSASSSMSMKKDQKEIEVILNLGQYLEDCEFDLFWHEYNLHGKIFDKYRSFEFEIRRYICLMIQSVHQNVSLSFLSELLLLDEGKPLESYINKVNLGWSIDKESNSVQIPKTDENSDEVQRTTQFISTDSMNQMLATFSF